MSKEFKLKVMAELLEPVRKKEDGSMDCALHAIVERTCTGEDYLYFCCSLVSSLIDKASGVGKDDLKKALALICIMPEDFLVNRKESVAVDVNQLNKERNGSHEE